MGDAIIIDGSIPLLKVFDECFDDPAFRKEFIKLVDRWQHPVTFNEKWNRFCARATLYPGKTDDEVKEIIWK